MSDIATDEELAAGRGYENLFVPGLCGPWAPHVIDAAGVAKNAKVLDVACGTGIASREAMTRVGAGGHVTGLDPAPGMIAAAKEIAPDMDWRLGAAEDLPFNDGTFDHVVSQFGIMFFQDRAKAMAEMHRVLKPGGTLALAAWHGLDQNPVYADIVQLMCTEVSDAAGDAVSLPFSLGDPKVLTTLSSDTGFTQTSTRSMLEQARFPSTRMMVETEARGWLPFFDIHLDDDQIAALLDASDGPLAPYAAQDGKARFQSAAYILTATKRDG